MFVFRNDESVGKENRGIPANKFYSDALGQTKKQKQKKRDTFQFENERYHESALETISNTYGSCGHEKEGGCLHGSSPLNLSASTSYSTELSSFSLHSDDSMDSSEDDESAPHHLTLSNVLYKPTFDSPVDRLIRATNPATPKRAAMDTFHKLQTWVAIEASIDEITTYSWEIRNRAIPELLDFIRVNVDDKECVLEALVLLQTLASLAENGDAQTGTLNAPLLIDAQAINVLVRALLSHNNHSTPSKRANSEVKPRHLAALQAQHMTCLFQNLWSFLMEIVLSPSAVKYFQRCDDAERRIQNKQQKHLQRMRLITALDLCLDRIVLSSFSIHTTSTFDHHQFWMDEVFQTLAMLLRIQNKQGEMQPNDEMRLVIWEKHIIRKCQQIMADRMDAAAWETFTGFEDEAQAQQEENEERLSIQALSIFEICLCDRGDGLSESVDARALEKFVYKSLPRFGHSVSIQTKGCQILNELASKHHGFQAALQLETSIDYTENNEIEFEAERKIDRDGKKEKLSLIHLAKALFQKPCLCHNFQSM